MDFHRVGASLWKFLHLCLAVPSTARESHRHGGIIVGEITIRGTRAQQNLMEWSRRVADCRSSGMSVTRWCTEHNVKPKTYYNWQKKVFAAMLSQQQAEASDTTTRFVELPLPADKTLSTAAEKQTDLVASVRIGSASLDVYGGASAEIVSALCGVLSHAE